MPTAHKSLTTLSVVAIFAAFPALADVTPDQIWADWQKQLQMAVSSDAGKLSIGSETKEGDVLVVRDVTLLEETLSEGRPQTTTVRLPELRFTPEKGGRVRVTLPPVTPISIVSGTDKVELDLFAEGDEIIASGDEASRDYAVKIASYGLRVSPSTSLTSGALNGELRISDLTGSYTTKTAAPREETTFALAAPAITYTFGGNDGSGFSFALNGKSDGLTLQGQLGHDPSKEGAAAAEALAFESAYTLGASTFTVTSKDSGQTFAANGQIGASAFALTAQNGVMKQTTSASDVTLAFNPGGMEMGLSLSALTSSAEVPYLSAPTAQPFQFGINLSNLALSETVWGLVDPASTLPRDPAQINLALSGDIMMREMPSENSLPPAPTRLSLDALNLQALGASVSGTGAFTFSESAAMEAMAGGIPNADGAAHFNFVGLQGLGQKLAALGLIGSEQVMGLNMMLGMFGTSTGADSYTTDLVVTGGKITLNGMPLN